MKKLLSITLALLIISSCKKKQQNINVCIEPNTYNDTVNSSISVSNCGDVLPSQVSVALNWGDGSKETSGTTGTHKYTKAGIYIIKLMANGNPASEKIGSAEKIERTIKIN